jgi:hypothetical protein
MSEISLNVNRLSILFKRQDFKHKKTFLHSSSIKIQLKYGNKERLKVKRKK